MTEPLLKILALPGSLRRASYNHGLLRAAAASAPDGVEVAIHPLDDVPLYDGDVEAAGWPPGVARLRDAIAGADALLLGSPEYNGGYTAVMKNAIDWASRRPNVLDGKPVAVVGASPGGFGTIRSQDQLRHVLAHTGLVQLVRPTLRVSRAEGLFAEDGTLTDEKTRAQVAGVVDALAAWTRQLARREETAMRLEGIHHVTAITADATENLAFYGGVLGLRLVKKTVNFDDPTAYHLYYGDETGAPGSIMTFFEYPGAAAGRAGDGMIHRIVWRVGSAAALDFWAERLAAHGIAARREGDALAFEDPEGLGIDLVVDASGEAPLVAAHPEIPAEHALTGIEGVRAWSSRPDATAPFLRASLELEAEGERYAVAGEQRSGSYELAQGGVAPGRPAAGTIHHVAWCARDDEELAAWRRRAGEAGGRVSPIMDRTYFRSIYFREPSGVLFELATAGPGFAIDEEPAQLGEALRLPPQHEHLRDRLQDILRPLVNPRAVSA